MVPYFFERRSRHFDLCVGPHAVQCILGLQDGGHVSLSSGEASGGRSMCVGGCVGGWVFMPVHMLTCMYVCVRV